MDVSGVASLGAGLSSIEFESEYNARVAGMQKGFVDFQGDMVMQLLDAVAIDPNVGVNLNVRV